MLYATNATETGSKIAISAKGLASRIAHCAGARARFWAGLAVFVLAVVR
jgi:hypothetical protein